MGGGDGAPPRRPAPGRGELAATRLDVRIRLSGTGPAGNAEHFVFVGASQCGKSTAAEAILRGSRNLIVIDYARKGQFDHLGVVGEEPELILRHPVVIWQPTRAAVARPARDFSDPWSRGLHWITTVRAGTGGRGVTVFHDEPRHTLPTNPHPYAAAMVDMGMGQGIAVGLATQGATRVYTPALDNAVHWFLFRIASATQRGSLSSSLELGDGPELGRLEPLRFFYWRQGMVSASGPHHVSELGDGRRRGGRKPVLGPTNGPPAISDGAPAATGAETLR